VKRFIPAFFCVVAAVAPTDPDADVERLGDGIGATGALPTVALHRDAIGVARFRG